MSDRVITEGRMTWEVACTHGRFKPHGCGCSRWMDEPHDPECDFGEDGCSGGTRHVVDPRRYRIDPVVKRIIDRVNALALDGPVSDGGEDRP